MSEFNEREITAVARVLYEDTSYARTYNATFDDAMPEGKERYRDLARRALTAAAVARDKQ